MHRRGFFGMMLAGAVGFFFPRKAKSAEIEIRGCLLSGSSRGDCKHYIGLPEKEDETTTDEYGRPHGWCEVCWRGEQIKRLETAIYEFTRNYGGETYAWCILEHVRTTPVHAGKD